MAILDNTILGELQDLMVEPNDLGLTWPSGLWTASEVVDLLNDRQRQFLQETQAIVTRSTQGIVPAVPRQTLPQNWLATRRIAFLPVGAGQTYQGLSPGDQFEMDQFDPTWATNPQARPTLYSDADPQTLEVVMLPPSLGNGTLHLLLVTQPTALTGLGVAFSVPDEFVPTVKWGAAEDMWSKVGRAQDPIRAKAAGELWSLGVEAAKAMMQGFA
jgi:hypothetical protein